MNRYLQFVNVCLQSKQREILHNNEIKYFSALLNTFLCFHLRFTDGAIVIIFKLGQQLRSHWADFIFFRISLVSHSEAITGQIGGLKKTEKMN